MKAEQIAKSIQDEEVVKVKGLEGGYVIFYVNDLLNLATLLKKTSGEEFLIVSAKYEDIEEYK